MLSTEPALPEPHWWGGCGTSLGPGGVFYAVLLYPIQIPAPLCRILPSRDPAFELGHWHPQEPSDSSAVQHLVKQSGRYVPDVSIVLSSSLGSLCAGDPVNCHVPAAGPQRHLEHDGPLSFCSHRHDHGMGK